MEEKIPAEGLDEFFPSTSPASTSNPDGAVIPMYSVVSAEKREKEELEMSLDQAVHAESSLIKYACGFSGTIVMEGYGLAMITYFFSFKSFREKYGANGILPYETRVLLPLLAQVGSIIGILIASPLANNHGYRKTTLIMIVLSAIFTLVPFFAPNVETLYVGFLLQGIPWGLFQVVSPAYASETASHQLRPVLTTWNNACWVIGQLIASGVGKGLERMADGLVPSIEPSWAYRIPFALQWIFCISLFLAVFVAPESPYWYLQQDRVEEAREATKKLVHEGDDEEAKLDLMRHTIHQESQLHDQRSLSNAGSDDTRDGGSGKVISKFRSMFSCLRGVDRRRTEIACGTWLIQALCGSSLIPWAVRLFEKAGLSSSNAFTVNLGVPAGGLLGTLFSWYLLRKCGRRTLYLTGCAAMALLLAFAAGLSYLQPVEVGAWGAGVVLIFYTIVYDLTVGPVCYCIVSEVPSIRLRALTISIARGMYLLAGIFNHLITPKMLEAATDDGWGWGSKTAYLYAVLCVFGLIYTWFRIPETNLQPRELDILFQSKADTKQFRQKFLQSRHQNGGAEA